MPICSPSAHLRTTDGTTPRCRRLSAHRASTRRGALFNFQDSRRNQIPPKPLALQSHRNPHQYPCLRPLTAAHGLVEATSRLPQSGVVSTKGVLASTSAFSGTDWAEIRPSPAWGSRRSALCRGQHQAVWSESSRFPVPEIGLAAPDHGRLPNRESGLRPLAVQHRALTEVTLRTWLVPVKS